MTGLASSTTLPVILLVPGACGSPAGYDNVLPHLHKAGFTNHQGPYPRCDPDDPAVATCGRDIASLRNDVLLPLLDHQKQDVIVVAHSYGGVIAGAAAKGLDKQPRSAQGQGETGVIGLIYVVGNIALEGETLLEAVGGVYPPFIKLDKPSKGLIVIEPIMDVLFNDMDASLAPEFESS